MSATGKRTILGVNVSITSYEEVAGLCAQWIAQRQTLAARARYVCVTSVHGIMTAMADRSFRAVLNGADLATPDGMPVVWALRSFGLPGQQRVYGPDLMLAVCRQAARLGHRIFLYGGRVETLRDLQRALENKMPGIEIAGAYSPPFRPLTPEEDASAVALIRDAKPDILFLGISTPKQEKWMRDHIQRLPGMVMFGVGAAFDFHAGRVPQAPPWMQRRGLEWFFRFLMEPRRLWKRYLFVTPLFIPMWAMQWMGLLRYRDPIEESTGSQIH